MAHIEVQTRGLAGFADYMRHFPEKTKVAALRAVNDVATRGGYQLLKTDIRKQINFPDGYLEDGRLVVYPATSENLTATVVGRQRATSLARFVQGGVVPGQRPPSIGLAVRSGAPSKIPGAFLVRLRAGPQLTNDLFNVGFAIRLKPGQTPRTHTLVGKEIFPNVYLLYGPSVDQVFREVASDDAEQIADLLQTQFNRQVSLFLDVLQ